MLYKEKVVRAPQWFKVGAEVRCDGEGSEILTVDHIEYAPNGLPDRVVLSHGCYEPLCKIYHPTTEQRIFVSVGHCDGCGLNFPDSHVRHDINGLNFCSRCHQQK